MKCSDNAPTDDVMSRLPMSGRTPVVDSDGLSHCSHNICYEFGSDIVIQELRKVILNDWKYESECLERFYYYLREEFSIQDDIVLPGGKVVVPESMQAQVVNSGYEAH